jgi:hypothetical protein
MESFAGADLHKRVTQLAVLREGQTPSQFRFANDPKTVHGVLKKLPRGIKIAVEGHGFMVKEEIDYGEFFKAWQQRAVSSL